MTVSNILQDPRFKELLDTMNQLSDGPFGSGPFLDGRTLAALFAAGLNKIMGIEAQDPEELRGEGDHSQGQTSYVRSLATGFRFDPQSTSPDNGTTIIKPNNIAPADPGRWVATWGGAIGVDLYTNPDPVPSAHGGVEAGDVLFGLNMTQMFDRVLRPYLYPAFTSFSISGQANPLEVGNSIPAAVTFLWGTSNPSNVLPNSITIRDVTNAINLATGLANDGSEAIVMGGPIQKTTQASHTFQIQGQNTKPGAMTPRNATYSWLWRVYAGINASASLTEAQIKALADFNTLSSTAIRTYNFSATGYKYLCYPDAFGLTGDWELGGFLVPKVDLGTVSVTNTYGQTTNYRVERTLNILGSAVDIVVKSP